MYDPLERYRSARDDIAELLDALRESVATETDRWHDADDDAQPRDGPRQRLRIVVRVMPAVGLRCDRFPQGVEQLGDVVTGTAISLERIVHGRDLAADDGEGLVASFLHERARVAFDVEAQHGLGVRFPHVQPPSGTPP